MNKRYIILTMVILLSGCASVHSRMVRLKDRNENTVYVQLTGTIPEAKEAVKQIGKEMGLIEVPEAEAIDFLFLRTNLVKAFTMNLLFGLAGPMSTGQTRLGFLFDYNKEQNMTTVTIAEEVSSIVRPSRFIIADKIRLKELTK